MGAIKDKGLPYAPITDRASTFGFVRWAKMCKENDMRPLFGVELAVSPDPTAKKPIFDHWTFLAKDSLEPIHQLLETATNQFRYEPVLSYRQAQELDCIKIVGSKSLVDLIDKDAKDLYFGLCPSLSAGQFSRFLTIGKPFVAVCDNKYPTKDDFGFYEVLVGRMANSQTYHQHILSDEEWAASLNMRIKQDPEVVASALTNREGIMAKSTAELIMGKMIVPEKPKTLRQMCEDGAELLHCDLSDPVYAARLDKELGLIDTKDFEDYFYIISDMVKWARERMIVGPARGSSCGSLVCYLLEITTVDPIPYGLIFERFIDLNRNDLPDIDIDFSDQKRQLVFDYMAEKYGEDHIARLGTVAMYQPRSAIKEAGTALNVPRWKCEKALDALIERSGGDSRALDTLEDTLRMTPNGKELLNDYPEILVATKMEGHPRHHSQHAAGIILTDKPVRDYVAVDSRSGATHCDKKDAEALDLLKIDALGLTQLSIFEDALHMVGLNHKYLESIPLDDQAAFDVLNKGYFSGIFQFQGIALQSLTRQTIVKELDDIIAITALARPGPLTSGGATQWIRRKNGEEKITYPHPLFKPYLEDTRGVVLYQEQVMEIGRNIGDLTWEDVTALRKAMSKSLGKEFFDQFGDKFKDAAEKKGIDRAVLVKVWDDLCAYGAWAFNKSHSVAYGLISYQCCWLKAHHPLQFAAATLNHATETAKQLAILREMHAEGVGYSAVDINLSTDKWQVGFKDDQQILVGPVQNVKGIGPKLTQQITDARARDEPLPDRALKLLGKAETNLDTLWPIADRIKEIVPDLATRNIHTTPTMIGDITEDHTVEKSFLVIGVAETINPRDENELVMIARRGYEIKDGITQSLNLQISDDSGTIYCKVGRFKYRKMGKAIVDRGRPTKSIYAIKGKAMAGRRFLMVDLVRYIGDMEQETDEVE